ncbi:MAG: site-2 protease family protein [Sutterellaceae bacterium]|nr:site-2 protease family protein [Sutterellaceae bacterium]MDD7442731.1 site-2 protease family protein [Sutterellaceae bacterium]MDY2867309.1 site-2 protease family protein [Mesosutterella sp.]
MNSIIQLIAVCAIPLIFSITLHEAAHGYAAMRFGDRTAWFAGRVTLNPAKHIDPFGTIILPLIMLAGSAATGAAGFIFGWAKPVPVNFGALRNPKRDMIWVALAGPASNLLQAILWGILLKVLLVLGVSEEFFLRMAAFGISINIFLMAFNLIPIPPLDGGRVAVGVLPWSVGRYLDRLEPYGMWIVLALVFVGASGFFVGPLVSFGQSVVMFVADL